MMPVIACLLPSLFFYAIVMMSDTNTHLEPYSSTILTKEKKKPAHLFTMNVLIWTHLLDNVDENTKSCQQHESCNLLIDSKITCLV